jgi:hypothetical protein
MFSIIMHHDIKRKHMIFLQGKQLRLKKEILAKIEKSFADINGSAESSKH